MYGILAGDNIHTSARKWMLWSSGVLWSSCERRFFKQAKDSIPSSSSSCAVWLMSSMSSMACYHWYACVAVGKCSVLLHCKLLMAPYVYNETRLMIFGSRLRYICIFYNFLRLVYKWTMKSVSPEFQGTAFRLRHCPKCMQASTISTRVDYQW